MIVWLASYPKSGNTWVRALLTNYLRDDDSPADINSLNGGPIASHRHWFDEWAGVEASMLPDTVIERLRPGVYRHMANEAPETLYLKVHDAWWRTDRDEGLFPADVTAGVIYILRNPLDLTPSWARHRGFGVAEAVADLCNADYALSRSSNRLSQQLRQRLRCWSGHARSWLDESGLPVHLVRFEDLKRDTEGIFAGVLRFCGLEATPERVRKAVAFSAFDELSRQEQSRGFKERPPGMSGQFFRQGQVGNWRQELPSPLADKLIGAHAETMRRFGYLDTSGRPVF